MKSWNGTNWGDINYEMNISKKWWNGRVKINEEKNQWKKNDLIEWLKREER